MDTQANSRSLNSISQDMGAMGRPLMKEYVQARQAAAMQAQLLSALFEGLQGRRPGNEMADKVVDVLRTVIDLFDAAGGADRSSRRGSAHDAGRIWGDPHAPGRERISGDPHYFGDNDRYDRHHHHHHGDDRTQRDDGRDRADANDPVVAGSARIWGDPHFVGQDGGRFDVQGEAGKVYNLLSDQGFQMNGRFQHYGEEGSGKTTVGAVGIVAGGDEVTVKGDGTVSVNGRELQDGDTVRLADGGYVTKDGDKTTVVAGEYKVEFDHKDSRKSGDYLNMTVSTDDANSDGVLPHGLLGQTFDVDDLARNGDRGQGAQGGGAIEQGGGRLSEEGDLNAITYYETNGLHDTDFNTFNMFHHGYDAPERTSEAYQEKLMELIVSAFATLAQSMMSNEKSAMQGFSEDFS